MKLSNVTTNEHGEPTCTITLTGYHEMYRFAHHLERGQVEFGEVGSKIIRRLKRRCTKASWDAWMRTLHGEQGRPDWDESIDAAIDDLDLAAEFEAEGRSWVEADEAGNVIEGGAGP